MDNRHLRVQLFGVLQEHIAPHILIEEPIQTVGELRKFLETNYLCLKKIPFLVAIDKVIASSEIMIKPGADIALLPPFSGG